jgi:hypothetical protein
LPPDDQCNKDANWVLRASGCRRPDAHTGLGETMRTVLASGDGDSDRDAGVVR